MCSEVLVTIGTWKFWKDTWERKFRTRICTYLPVTWLRTKLTSTTSLMTTLKETLKISLDTIFSLNVPEWKRYAECAKIIFSRIVLESCKYLGKCGIISAFTMWQKVLFLMKICYCWAAWDRSSSVILNFPSHIQQQLSYWTLENPK